MDAEKPPSVSKEWGLNTSQQLEIASSMLEKATSELQDLIKELRDDQPVKPEDDKA